MPTGALLGATSAPSERSGQVHPPTAQGEAPMLPSICRRSLPLAAGVCSLLLGLALVSPATLANQTLRYQITAGADDAEELLLSGEVDLTSSDLEITEDGDDNQLVGLRFTDIELPQGLPILGAYIQFTTDEDDKSTPIPSTCHRGRGERRHAAAFTEDRKTSAPAPAPPSRSPGPASRPGPSSTRPARPSARRI
jgi:hypothetical protein